MYFVGGCTVYTLLAKSLEKYIAHYRTIKIHNRSNTVDSLLSLCPSLSLSLSQLYFILTPPPSSLHCTYCIYTTDLL
jgi:hypothetical protein